MQVGAITSELVPDYSSASAAASAFSYSSIPCLKRNETQLNAFPEGVVVVREDGTTELVTFENSETIAAEEGAAASKEANAEEGGQAAEEGASKGAVLGGVIVATAIGTMMLVALVLLVWRKRRRRTQQERSNLQLNEKAQLGARDSDVERNVLLNGNHLYKSTGPWKRSHDAPTGASSSIQSPGSLLESEGASGGPHAWGQGGSSYRKDEGAAKDTLNDRGAVQHAAYTEEAHVCGLTNDSASGKTIASGTLDAVSERGSQSTLHMESPLPTDVQVTHLQVLSQNITDSHRIC